ncbi:MAG TPA: hypothetical protein PLI09_21590 [Candidatus Hydrogenedentes bacterium]|nr:hypothetical protein [Candidatus Hydrogenedentota bacterium]
MTPSALEAQRILRDSSLFQWYVIPLFALVVYVYANEIERRNWNLVLNGLALWGIDWFNEIWNGLVLHFTQYAPVWGAPGKTAYLILIGLNIEICFMFAVAGIVFSKMLPADKRLKILGVPNRLFFALIFAAFCAFVEYLLNLVGALSWDYTWWSRSAPWVIFLFGYFPFFLVCFWVFDIEKLKRKIGVISAIYVIDAIGLGLFAGILKWI